jgi:predicted O-methyltransferase YrrM
MYSRFQLALRYISYYLTAANGKGHGIHSPFVFELITDVLNDKHCYYAYPLVEKLRDELLQNDTLLPVEDFGAGSQHAATRNRKISHIARYAAKPAKYGQLLFRIVNHYQPRRILELGTSLGITTAYLASANRSAQVVTLEGAAAVAQTAQRNFNQLQLHNVTIVQGNFDDTLQAAAEGLQKIDLVFIDGNHRETPTLQYFAQLLPFLHHQSLLIFDDIHWSAGMESAWQKIQQHPAVTLTIDLFFIGIVVLNPAIKTPQHFTIRF